LTAALAGQGLSEDKVCLGVGRVQCHGLAGSPLRFGVVAELVAGRSEMGERVQPRMHVIVPCTCESNIERSHRLVIAPLAQGDVPKLGTHRAEVRILVGAACAYNLARSRSPSSRAAVVASWLKVRVVAVQCERPIERGERPLREIVHPAVRWRRGPCRRAGGPGSRGCTRSQARA